MSFLDRIYESDSFCHFRITKNRTKIELPQELLKTILNYEIFYIPERNEVLCSSQKVLEKYLENPVSINIANEIIFARNLNQKYNIFKQLVLNGIKNIEFAQKQPKDSARDLYLDHCLYVLSMIYCCFCFGMDSNYSFVENVGWTNITYSFIGLSSISKLGFSRLNFNKNHLEKNDKRKDLKMIPFFLPYVFSSFAGKHSVSGMNYQVCERLSIIQEIQLSKKLGFNVVENFNYIGSLYSSLGESFIVYPEEIAKITVPKNSECVFINYSNAYAQMYGRNLSGTAFSFLTDWTLNHMNDEFDGDPEGTFSVNPGKLMIRHL